MWTEAELAYMAGIIDGEGTISIGNRFYVRKGMRKRTHRPLISVSNTKFELIEWIEKRFKGSIDSKKQPNPKAKIIYRWTMSSGPVMDDFLREISPFLVIKKDQAFILSECRKLMWKGMRHIAPQVMNQRDELAGKIRVLNQRGVS